MSQTASERTGGPNGGESSRLTWVIPVAAFTALAVAYFLWPAFEAVVDNAYGILTSGDRERIQEWVGGFGVWGPLAIVAIMLAQTVLAVIPSVLIMVVSVLAYGPVWGGLLSWGGLVLAAALAYGIGRALGPVTVDRLLGHSTVEKIQGFVNRYGVWGVIAARVSPALSTDAVSFVAGLTRMGFARFLLATAVGILPLAVLISLLGRDVQNLWTGLIVISAVSVAVFIGYVIYDKRREAPQSEREG